jgi:hypothetical protein
MSTDALTKPAAVTAIPAAPRVSRALLALVSAATIAIAPIAGPALGLVAGGHGGGSSPVYILARLSHDIGHNDWAFQGGLTGRIDWIVSYCALALLWLITALWIRRRTVRILTRRRLWLKVLAAALGTELAAGLLTLGAGLLAQQTSSRLGPAVLRAADLCSPWWSCVAVLVVAAFAELNSAALRAAVAYGVLLAALLLVPLPGPDALKALILAAAAAVPAFLTSDPPATAPAAEIKPDDAATD